MLQSSCSPRREGPAAQAGRGAAAPAARDAVLDDGRRPDLGLPCCSAGCCSAAPPCRPRWRAGPGSAALRGAAGRFLDTLRREPSAIYVHTRASARRCGATPGGRWRCRRTRARRPRCSASRRRAACRAPWCAARVELLACDMVAPAPPGGDPGAGPGASWRRRATSPASWRCRNRPPLPGADERGQRDDPAVPRSGLVAAPGPAGARLRRHHRRSGLGALTYSRPSLVGRRPAGRRRDLAAPPAVLFDRRRSPSCWSPWRGRSSATPGRRA